MSPACGSSNQCQTIATEISSVTDGRKYTPRSRPMPRNRRFKNTARKNANNVMNGTYPTTKYVELAKVFQKSGSSNRRRMLAKTTKLGAWSSFQSVNDSAREARTGRKLKDRKPSRLIDMNR